MALAARFASVMPHVFGLGREHFEVRRIVVAFVAINVMHDLALTQGATDFLSGNQTMNLRVTASPQIAVGSEYRFVAALLWLQRLGRISVSPQPVVMPIAETARQMRV